MRIGLDSGAGKAWAWAAACAAAAAAAARASVDRPGGRGRPWRRPWPPSAVTPHSKSEREKRFKKKK